MSRTRGSPRLGTERRNAWRSHSSEWPTIAQSLINERTRERTCAPGKRRQRSLRYRGKEMQDSEMQGDCLLASHLLEAQGRGCKDLFCHSREAREVIYHRLLGHDELVQKHATVLSKRGMFVQAWD